jgi:hypothetical protein
VTLVKAGGIEVLRETQKAQALGAEPTAELNHLWVKAAPAAPLARRSAPA